MRGGNLRTVTLTLTLRLGNGAAWPGVGLRDGRTLEATSRGPALFFGWDCFFVVFLTRSIGIPSRLTTAVGLGSDEGRVSARVPALPATIRPTLALRWPFHWPCSAPRTGHLEPTSSSRDGYAAGIAPRGVSAHCEPPRGPFVYISGFRAAGQGCNYSVPQSGSSLDSGFRKRSRPCRLLQATDATTLTPALQAAAASVLRFLVPSLASDGRCLFRQATGPFSASRSGSGNWRCRLSFFTLDSAHCQRTCGRPSSAMIGTPHLSISGGQGQRALGNWYRLVDGRANAVW